MSRRTWRTRTKANIYVIDLFFPQSFDSNGTFGLSLHFPISYPTVVDLCGILQVDKSVSSCRRIYEKRDFMYRPYATSHGFARKMCSTCVSRAAEKYVWLRISKGQRSAFMWTMFFPIARPVERPQCSFSSSLLFIGKVITNLFTSLQMNHWPERT